MSPLVVDLHDDDVPIFVLRNRRLYYLPRNVILARTEVAICIGSHLPRQRAKRRIIFPLGGRIQAEVGPGADGGVIGRRRGVDLSFLLREEGHAGYNYQDNDCSGGNKV